MENNGNRFPSLEDRIKQKQLMPVTLLQNSSQNTINLIIRAKTATVYAGNFFLERQFESAWDRKQVYVFARRGVDAKQNQTFLFQVCRMKMENNFSMITEKSLLMLVEGNATNEAEVIQVLKAKKENLTMKNFELDEFDDGGFKMCDNMEFYLNECVLTVNHENPTYIFYFIITAVLIYILIVTAILFYQNSV